MFKKQKTYSFFFNVNLWTWIGNFFNSFLSHRNESNLSIIKSHFQKEEWTKKLDIFKSKIQMTLDFLSKLKENKIKLTIKNKKYSVTELIKLTNIKKAYADMSSETQKEIDDLYTDEIDNRALIVDSDYKDKLLDSFLISIRFLVRDEFIKAKITEITINMTTYLIASLITNHKKKFTQLPKNTQTELIDLFVDQIDSKKLFNARKDSLLKTIKPALQLFATAKITKFQIGEDSYRIHNLIAHLDKTGSELVGSAETEFNFLRWTSTNDEKLNEKLISIYKNKLDLFLTDIKPILQFFWNNNTTEININNKDYQIGALTANLHKEGSAQVGTAKTELMELFIDKINDLKLTTVLSQKYKLDYFFVTIKPSLQALFDMNIIAVIIDAKHYPIGNLTANLDQKGSELVGVAKNELLALYNYNFNSLKQLLNDLEKNLINYKTSLDNYKNEIQSILQEFATDKITQIKIDGTTYQVDLLLQDANLNKKGSELPQDARNEMLVLVHDGVTKTQLDTALTAILKTRAVAATSPQTPKTQTQKKLIICLSVGGGVLTLATLGGFLYWFFKVKK